MLNPYLMTHDPTPTESVTPPPPRQPHLRGARRSTHSGAAWRAVQLLLCLLSLGWGGAQNPLEAYRAASDALAQSAAALDSVESLDALRRAETAFTSLSDLLEPGLRGGLAATFARAEQAIVNESPTDLRVQVAVLRGGVQRALYARALDMAPDDPAAARRLLGVLATDLSFADTDFLGEERAALQRAFERRLAGLGLARLEAIGETREARYETLAELYSYLFLVQDSPRLPPDTQATLLGAIDQLVAGEAQKRALTTLREQLRSFAAAAEPPVQEAADQGRAAEAPERLAETPAAAEERAPASPERGAPRLAESLAEGLADGLLSAAPSTTAEADSAAQQAAPRGAADTTADTTADKTPSAPPAPQAASNAETDGLSARLRTPLLIGAGVLAFAALARLLRRRSPTPRRDLALALLLLPAGYEGLLALAGALAPVVGAPTMAELSRFSLFADPTAQLLWALLTALAVLALGLDKRRDAPIEADPERTRPRVDKGQAVSVSPADTRAAPTAKVTAAQLAASSTLDWDEDF